jgi:hypothetical protein
MIEPAFVKRVHAVLILLLIVVLIVIISIAGLFRFLIALGRDVEIVIRPAGQAGDAETGLISSRESPESAPWQSASRRLPKGARR